MSRQVLIALFVGFSTFMPPFKTNGQIPPSKYMKPYKHSLVGEWEGTLQNRTPLRLTISACDENVSGFYSLENEFTTIEMTGVWKDLDACNAFYLG